MQTHAPLILILRILCEAGNDNGNMNHNYTVSFRFVISDLIFYTLLSLGNGYPCDVHVSPQGYDTYRTDQQYDSQEIPGLPPRKRLHHALIPGFDVINGAPLQNQSMGLQS